MGLNAGNKSNDNDDDDDNHDVRAIGFSFIEKVLGIVRKGGEL